MSFIATAKNPKQKKIADAVRAALCAYQKQMGLPDDEGM
jgi:hypothetical protein